MNDLFNEQEAESGPVECLGQTFPSDQARRAHYLKLQTEKLKDPEFRAIEGFPQGTDEAILAMSDPPYYTNPGDIVLDGYDGSGNVPTQITNYLSKNFHDYRGLDKDAPRLIAKAKDFPTIIVIAKKIPETTLLEDEKLLLWYDQALTRMEAD